MNEVHLNDEFSKWRDWLSTHALPLWGGRGFDQKNQRFEERLDSKGHPIADVPLRLMVQGRQIFVFAEASRLGLFPAGQDLAIAAYHSMVKDFYKADDAPGWVFSISRSGKVSSGVRDTYAHAFAMFAMAHYYSLTRDTGALVLADHTWAFLDEHLAAPNGGFLDANPRVDALRRQNPHMHLLEAAMWLFQVSGEERFLHRAKSIAVLFQNCFFDRQTGSLIEYLDNQLTQAPGHAGGLREPGHQYEWAWLLFWLYRTKGVSESNEAARLIGHADTFGWTNDGLIYDEILSNGIVASPQVRLWPMTEAIKALAVCSGLPTADRVQRLAKIVLAMRTTFLDPAYPGGWIDRFTEDRSPATDFMPASSLYHVVCAYSELDRLISTIQLNSA